MRSKRASRDGGTGPGEREGETALIKRRNSGREKTANILDAARQRDKIIVLSE